jgi:hypothetical protein
MVLASSMVTKNIPPNTTWGGHPAVDLTAKVGPPFAPVTLEEKFVRLCDKIDAWMRGQPVTEAPPAGPGRPGWHAAGGVAATMADFQPDDVTSVFDLRDRTYSKLRTRSEIAFMRFLLPHIKFYPRSGADGPMP